MGISAVTAFLREALDHKGLTQEDLAKEIGLSLRQTNRWLTGQSKAKEDQVLRALAFLEPPMRVIKRLSGPSATPEQGRRAAKSWYTGAFEELREEFPDFSEEEIIEALMRSAERVQARNPALIQRLIGYAESLAGKEDPRG